MYSGVYSDVYSTGKNCAHEKKYRDGQNIISIPSLAMCT